MLWKNNETVKNTNIESGISLSLSYFSEENEGGNKYEIIATNKNMNKKETVQNSDSKSKIETTYKSIFYNDSKTQNFLNEDNQLNNNHTIFSSKI